MFIIELLIGALLISLTVAIHAIVLDHLIDLVRRHKNQARLIFKRFWKIPLLMGAVLGVFLAHIVQIWLWAFFYLLVGALDSLETAVYFSTIMFTTVGLGDVVLDHEWRLLASFEGANGFLLFGWSTAFIFEIMSKLYEQEG